jgi:hypothetical protein
MSIRFVTGIQQPKEMKLKTRFSQSKDNKAYKEWRIVVGEVFITSNNKMNANNMSSNYDPRTDPNRKF